MVYAVALLLALLWSGSIVAQTVPGRFPPGTVYGNPNALGGAEANPSTQQTFATRWTTALRPASPAQGAFGFNTDTSTYEAYNGTNWTTLSPGAFDVRAFGAVGNDTGNQAPAINAATTAATAAGVGAVYIPGGTYRIQASASATSRINAVSNMTIYGDGAGSTIIDCDDTVAAFAGNFACMGINATALNNFTLRGVTLKGKALTSPISSGFGLLQLTPSPTGNQYNCNNIRIEDNEFLESRYFGMAIKACVGVIVRNNHVAKTARDGIDVWDSANVLITGNRIENSNDDSISCQQSAFSQAGTLVAPEPSGCIITNNTIIESQGITSYGSKLTVISGNVIKRSTSFGIAVDAFMTSVGGEPSPATSVTVTGNVISDIFCRPGADTYNANCLYLQIGGGPKKVKIPAYGTTGTSGLYYAIDADVDATSPGGVMFNIGNNVLSRTLPPNSTGFSDWGFNPSGWWTCKFRSPAAGTTGIDDITCDYVNTPVAEANLNVTAVRFREALSKSKLHNNIVDTSGIAVQFAGAVDTPTDLDYDLEITNNQFLNCNLTTGNGCINWSYGTTLYQRILIKDNVFDGDPRFVASLRGAAGTWTSTGIPVAIGMGAVSGLSIIDNIFRNFNQINTGTGTNYVTGNKVYANPVGGVGCSSSNVGVRCIPAGDTGYTTLQEDSAPASATYGKLLSGEPTTPEVPNSWTTALRPTSPTQGTFGYNTDTDVMEFYNGTNWQAPGDTISIFAFGAQCNGVAAHDDAPAINAALDFVRANPAYGTTKAADIVGSMERACILLTPLNMTGLNNSVLLAPFKFRDFFFDCRFVGVCIDAMGSRAIHWSNIALITGATPTIGIQIGRLQINQQADSHEFDNVQIFGSFSQCGIYNFGSEVSSYKKLTIKNLAGGYAACWDGNNHFNTSAIFPYTTSASSFSIATGAGKVFTVPSGGVFVSTAGNMVKVQSRANTANWMLGTVTSYSGTSLTLNITSVGGSGGPFTDWDVFPSVAQHIAVSATVNGVADSYFASRSGSSAVPLWIGANSVFRMTNTYACGACDAIGTTDRLIDFDTSGSQASGVHDIFIQVNPEGVQANTVLFRNTGAYAVPSIRNISFEMSGTNSAGVFKLHASEITTITTMGFNFTQGLALTALFPSNTVFEPADVSKWTVLGGKIEVNAASIWNGPSNFTGMLCIAGVCTNYMSTRTWTTAQRPASPTQGQFGFNTTTEQFEYWFGEINVTAAVTSSAGTTCVPVSGTSVAQISGVSGTGAKWVGTVPVSAGAIASGATVFILGAGNYSVAPNATDTVTFQATSSCTGAPTVAVTTENVWQTADDGVISVKTFGAKGDQFTDDTAAINAAIAFARTRTPHTLRPVRVYLPPGGYLISDSINWTNWSQQVANTPPGFVINQGPAIILSGYGAMLQTRGAVWPNNHPMIDMMGSYNTQIEGITLFGSCALGFVTSVGIQMGRIADNQSAGFHHLLDVKVNGCFGLAGIYNLASEQNLYTNPQIRLSNLSSSPGDAAGPPSNLKGPYGIILDGSNHWDISARSWSYVNSGGTGGVTTICPGGAATATATFNIATDEVTWTGHPFFPSTKVQGPCAISFTGGTLPTLLTATATYWVIPTSVTANTFKIATSSALATAGTAIDLTGAPSGTTTAVAFGDHQSFIANTMTMGGIFPFVGGIGSSVWVSGDAEQLTFNGTYVQAPPGVGGFCVYVNADSSADTQFALWNFNNFHCEAEHTRTFYFGSRLASAVTSYDLHGFRYTDAANFANAGAVFDIDTSTPLATVNFQNADVQIERFPAAGAKVVFGDPTKFTFSGRYWSTTSAEWNSISNNGEVCFAGECDTYSTVDVMAYGAKCDNATDDAAAINRAINAARTVAFNNTFGVTKATIEFPKDRVCIINSPLDMTATFAGASTAYNRGLLIPGVTFRNARLRCFSTTVCIDAIGAGYIVWENVQLNGSAGAPPKIGILVGRIDPAIAAPGHKFSHVAIGGSFSTAAYYNLASEVDDWQDPYIVNDSTTGYAVILDGLRYSGFPEYPTGVTSTFRTINLVLDALDGSNDHNFGPGKIGAASSKAVWIGGAGPVRWNTYLFVSGASGCNVILYMRSNTAFNNEGLTFRTHFESTPNVANHFCIDNHATATTPILNNFTFTEENGAQASQSVFKIIGTATMVNLRSAYINYVKNPPAVSQTLLDQPAKYSITGFVGLSTTAEWVLPALFNGTLCIAGKCDFYPGNVVLGPSATPMGLYSVVGVAPGGTGGNYAIGDRLVIAGGTGTAAAITVTRTRAATATVGTAGSGCTPTSGTATLTGVGGTGTKWTATGVTVAGGNIATGAITVTTGGSYTVSPSTAASGETVTVSGGFSCTTPPLMTLTIGANAAGIIASGAYSILPTGPTIGQASSSGTGTGALWTPTWSFVPPLPIDTPATAAGATGTTSYGYQAGLANTTGANNTWVGFTAGTANTTGSANVGIGGNALNDNTTGGSNTAVGQNALTAVTTTSNNTAMGLNTLITHTGSGATGIGAGALALATGNNNTALGVSAGNQITTGTANLILGPVVASSVGTGLVDGTNNILLGTTNTCTTAATNTSSSFSVCANSGTIPLLRGDLVAASMNLVVGGPIATPSPVTKTGTSGTAGALEASVIINASGTFTLTLPAASAAPGRWLHVKSITAQIVNSATSNVVPMTSATAGTAIFTASAGQWAILQSDGTSWVKMAGN